MKKFLIKISYTVLPVWLFLVSMAVYLMVTGDNTGDLMRLALIKGGPEYRDSICLNLLPRVYYESVDNDSVLRGSTRDVLVIGDSFSHGGGVGKEGDYVNYLAHDSERHVTVYTPQDPTLSSPMQIAYDLLKLGGVDSTCIKNLVVQEVERYLVGRHIEFTTQHTSLSHSLPASEQKAAPASAKKEVSPLLRVKDYIFYHCFGANPIYDVKLRQPMFGGAQPDRLYFYNEDVKFGIDLDEKAAHKVKTCFDEVIEMAAARGVNLVIVIACDKYDMYQDFILDNPYPAKTLNEDIERLMAPELDRFVIAKRVLHPLVEQGVKDVYLFNDTHWSPASSRLIAAEVAKKLK